MKAVLAALAIAGFFAALAPSSAEATVYVCRASGFGSSGVAKSVDVVRAKRLALDRCERGAALRTCIITSCRP